MAEERRRQKREEEAALLKKQFDLSMDDMRELEYQEDGTWIERDPNSQVFYMTNDGCRHYIHVGNKKHYVYDYHFKHEWREYTPYVPIESKSWITNIIQKLQSLTPRIF